MKSEKYRLQLEDWNPLTAEHVRATNTLAELYKMVCKVFHLSEMEHRQLKTTAKSEPALITWKPNSKKDKNEIV
jgi:hypothetical protein